MSIGITRRAAALAKQSPIFYPGDELHRIKQAKVQRALEEESLDAFLFFKAEAVRYITDFYVKGFRPFMEPEYVVLVDEGQGAGRRLHLGQRRFADPVSLGHRRCAEAAACGRLGQRDRADDFGLWPRRWHASAPT